MFQVEFDGKGLFRIVHPKSGMKGAWATYRDLATLTLKVSAPTGPQEKTYVAGTAYGLLPKAETVYEVIPQPTETSMVDVPTGKDSRSSG